MSIQVGVRVRPFNTREKEHHSECIIEMPGQNQTKIKDETGKERKWLKWLNKQKWTTLFADGNHECFPRLNSYPVKEWHGGKVHEILPKVLHLMRGEIFELEGKSIFVMGGASSHDRGPAVGDTEQVIGKF